MYIGLLKCLVHCCSCRAAVMSSVSGRAWTLRTSRRSSGFRVQQDTPAGSEGTDFHTDPDFSLSYCSCWREKDLLGSAAQKLRGNPPTLPIPPTNPHFFKTKMLF